MGRIDFDASYINWFLQRTTDRAFISIEYCPLFMEANPGCIGLALISLLRVGSR